MKVARVANVAKFQTLSFSGYQACGGLERLQNFGLYHCLDIKFARVAKVAKFQTLSFLGYQGCEGCKGCKISDFIIFRISRLQLLRRFQDFRLCHSQDIKVPRVAKVAKRHTLSFSGY